MSLADLLPDTKVQLYELDMTSIGYSDYFRFHGYECEAVLFNGQTYTPIAMKAEGFEYSINSQPEPKITIADSKTVRAWFKSRRYLRGAIVRRLTTLSQFIGLPPNANYLARPPEEFFVNRPSTISRLGIVMELRSALDLYGVKFPGEQIMQAEFPGVEQIRSNT
jgi:lambda family phage minor tail protein L